MNEHPAAEGAEMSQFRKKPVVIDAFQWQGDFVALDARGCTRWDIPRTANIIVLKKATG